MDVAAATRIRGVENYAELLASLRADVLFCNANEADVLGITAELPHWAPALVLVHDGPRPTRVRTRGRAWEVSVEPVEVRDTTGCGDAFAAGVLAGWRAGSVLLDSVRTGHAAAAAVAQVVGAQPPS